MESRAECLRRAERLNRDRLAVIRPAQDEDRTLTIEEQRRYDLLTREWRRWLQAADTAPMTLTPEGHIVYSEEEYRRMVTPTRGATPVAVRSHTPEPDDDDRRPRGPALFSRKRLARRQTTTERVIAFALLAVSWAGILIFGGGGIDSWLALTPIWAGFAAAVIVQGVCTWVQWTYAADRWRSPWWLLSFGLSTSGTLAGFWALAHPWLARVLQSAQVPPDTAPYFAGAMLVFFAGLLDYLPEQILTD
jgi:hypothetical protein